MSCPRSLSVVLFLAPMALLVGCSEQPSTDPAEAELLPQHIDTWSLAAEPGLYVGDQLFELVNGGAELYHSFGFVQAWSAEYLADDQTSIAVEIYEMGNAEAARKIYEARSIQGGESQDPAIGDHATLESYYLSFRSGPYMVTLTGFDSDERTRDGLLLLGRALAARLGGAT